MDIKDNLKQGSISEVDKNTYLGFYRVDRDGNLVNRNEVNTKLTNELNSPALKDVSTVGRYYLNQIQSEDYFLPAPAMLTKNFNWLTFSETDVVIEDAYVDYKYLRSILDQKQYNTLVVNNNLSQYYATPHVLNSFRANYEDFN